MRPFSVPHTSWYMPARRRAAVSGAGALPSIPARRRPRGRHAARRPGCATGLAGGLHARAGARAAVRGGWAAGAARPHGALTVPQHLHACGHRLAGMCGCPMHWMEAPPLAWLTSLQRKHAGEPGCVNTLRFSAQQQRAPASSLRWTAAPCWDVGL